ncbi:MAG: hypothetical protein M1830_008655 [Pleopsidium flavum]|nr:MAG: hypothetical protein M1830_008655 [Pleopsidium flavum]
MTPAQSETSWPTYAAYVDALARVDSNFEWLARFFSRSQQGVSTGEQLNILESNNDTLEDHACSLDELESPPRPGSTRIVVLSYNEAWSLDREVLDKVALSLNLPPFFLWQHLQYDGHQGEAAYPKDLSDPSHNKPFPAASEVLSLEIGWTPYFHMSGMIASPATPLTGAVVMVLVRDRGFKLKLSHSAQTPGPASISSYNFSGFWRPEEFWRSLGSMSPISITAANQTPHDFFCPWIGGIHDFIANAMMEGKTSLRLFKNIEDFDEGSLEIITSDIEFNHTILWENVSNLNDYLWAHPEVRTPAMATVLKDLEMLQSKSEALQRRGQVLMNRLVSTLALKESRRSIEQSTSTKRLSQLAYIFLPLSLSTSVFGMNVIELQNTQLRVFFGTAVITLATSLILWLFLGWLSRPEVVNNVAGIGKAAIILFKFFWLAPSHATMLILFAFCHSTVHTRLVLIHIGLWDIIWNEEAPKPAGFSLSLMIGQRTHWSRFWYQKITAVESFAKTSGWRKRYFWQKKATQEDKNVIIPGA